MKRIFAILLIVVFALSLQTMAQDKAKEQAMVKATPSLTVADAKLGTGIQDKKIVGESAEFALNEKVYLWLELTGGPADSITVTWKAGEKSYVTKLKVGGPTFHTWAYKTAAIAGPWTVTVSDASGATLKDLSFKVGAK